MDETRDEQKEWPNEEVAAGTAAVTPVELGVMDEIRDA